MFKSLVLNAVSLVSIYFFDWLLLPLAQGLVHHQQARHRTQREVAGVRPEQQAVAGPSVQPEPGEPEAAAAAGHHHH